MTSWRKSTPRGKDSKRTEGATDRRAEPIQPGANSRIHRTSSRAKPPKAAPVGEGDRAEIMSASAPKAMASRSIPMYPPAARDTSTEARLAKILV